MAKPIYNENGSIEDWSDEGAEVIDLLSEIDFFWALKKLRPSEAEIIKLKREGYTYREIQAKLKVSSKTIRKAIWHLNSIIE